MNYSFMNAKISSLFNWIQDCTFEHFIFPNHHDTCSSRIRVIVTHELRPSTCFPPSGKLRPPLLEVFIVDLPRSN